MTDELEQIAIARATALGRPVVVTAWTGGDRATITDLDEDGEIADVHRGVRLNRPAAGSDEDEAA